LSLVSHLYVHETSLTTTSGCCNPWECRINN